MTYFCVCRYLYCDEISLEPGNVLSTLYAAKKYIAPHLARACIKYLETNVDTSNVCLLLSQSRLFDESELIQRCWNVLDFQAEVALQADSFIDIDYQTLEQILCRDTLNAKETVVFAAAKRWAEAECTRQGRDTSPQQSREVLGDALYLLRLPTMTPSDFANGAGQSRLLSTEETNDLFFYFTAENKPKLRFPISHRTGLIRRCHRFKSIKPSEGTYMGQLDSLQFSVDKTISVCGFGLYGRPGDVVEYQVNVSLKCNGVTLGEKCQSMFSGGPNDIVDVFFDRPQRIDANTRYTICLYQENPNGMQEKYGQTGMTSVICDNVKFTFKNSGDRNNGTNVGSGQIPEILFYCWPDQRIQLIHRWLKGKET